MEEESANYIVEDIQKEEFQLDNEIVKEVGVHETENSEYVNRVTATRKYRQRRSGGSSHSSGSPGGGRKSIDVSCSEAAAAAERQTGGDRRPAGGDAVVRLSSEKSEAVAVP